MIRLPCTCQLNRIRPLDAIGAFKLPDHSLSMAIPGVATFSHGKTRHPGVFTPDGTSLTAGLNSKYVGCASLLFSLHRLLGRSAQLRSNGASSAAPINSECLGGTASHYSMIQIASFETQDPNRPKRFRFALFSLLLQLSRPRD
jgi:hypothetical protein